MPDIDTKIDAAIAAPIADAKTDLDRIKDFVRGDVAKAQIERASLEATIATPHGHMIFGVFLYIAGLATGVALSHLH